MYIHMCAHVEREKYIQQRSQRVWRYVYMHTKVCMCVYIDNYKDKQIEMHTKDTKDKDLYTHMRM